MTSSATRPAFPIIRRGLQQPPRSPTAHICLSLSVTHPAGTQKDVVPDRHAALRLTAPAKSLRQLRLCLCAERDSTGPLHALHVLGAPVQVSTIRTVLQHLPHSLLQTLDSSVANQSPSQALGYRQRRQQPCSTLHLPQKDCSNIVDALGESKGWTIRKRRHSVHSRTPPVPGEPSQGKMW